MRDDGGMVVRVTILNVLMCPSVAKVVHQTADGRRSVLYNCGVRGINGTRGNGNARDAFTVVASRVYKVDKVMRRRMCRVRRKTRKFRTNRVLPRNVIRVISTIRGNHTCAVQVCVCVRARGHRLDA